MCDTHDDLGLGQNRSDPIDSPMHSHFRHSSLFNDSAAHDLCLDPTVEPGRHCTSPSPTKAKLQPKGRKRKVAGPSNGSLCGIQLSKGTANEGIPPASAEHGGVEAQGSTTGEQAIVARTWRQSSLKRNTLKKSIAKVSGTFLSARAKAAEDRSAVILALATEWVQITEEELSGTISSHHAHAIREAWQKRVYTLSQFQRRRVYSKVDKLYNEWLLDPFLHKRLDQPWLDAVAHAQYVRPNPLLTHMIV